MGHVKVPVRISNPENPGLSVDVVDALVDTGATWTSVPRSLVTNLNLRHEGSVRVNTAAGAQELEHSFARIEVAGKSLVTHLLISDSLPTVLIGVTTLEALGLAVDPPKERLVESEVYLL
jgi:clan AA aspartic protease